MFTDDELTALIADGESDRVEFTQACNDLDKVRQAICAFANDLPNHKAPGVMFIGLKDDRNCADLEIDDTLLKRLGDLRFDGKIMPFPVMHVNKRTLNGGDVAVIQVEPSDNPPLRVDGRCWIRSGPRRAQATAEEERRLTEKRRWGTLPFDMHPVKGASIESDLDMARFRQEYLPNAVSPEALRENSRDEREQLQALRLINQEGIPTTTAILMLGKAPRDWFHAAYIQFVRYDGNENSAPIKSQKTISGALPDQIKEIDTVLHANISVALDTSGERHIEQPDYPYLALRELVRNAVIHRNYESASTPARIYWYTDTVEIISPGSLYGEVSRENFGNGQATSYRNPTITEALKNLGFIQRFGRGIPTAQKELERNGNPKLEFAIEDNFVHFTLRKRQ